MHQGGGGRGLRQHEVRRGGGFGVGGGGGGGGSGAQRSRGRTVTSQLGCHGNQAAVGTIGGWGVRHTVSHPCIKMQVYMGSVALHTGTLQTGSAGQCRGTRWLHSLHLIPYCHLSCHHQCCSGDTNAKARQGKAMWRAQARADTLHAGTPFFVGKYGTARHCQACCAVVALCCATLQGATLRQRQSMLQPSVSLYFLYLLIY